MSKTKGPSRALYMCINILDDIICKVKISFE